MSYVSYGIDYNTFQFDQQICQSHADQKHILFPLFCVVFSNLLHVYDLPQLTPAVCNFVLDPGYILLAKLPQWNKCVKKKNLQLFLFETLLKMLSNIDLLVSTKLVKILKRGKGEKRKSFAKSYKAHTHYKTDIEVSKGCGYRIQIL